jgi:hypothetical protein
VIAQTKDSDKENVLAIDAHTDWVQVGLGINDNGSSAVGILEIAVQLAGFSANNTVRFGWWKRVFSEPNTTSLNSDKRSAIRFAFTPTST